MCAYQSSGSKNYYLECFAFDYDFFIDLNKKELW